MRYYDITISDLKTGKIYQPPSLKGLSTISTRNGVTLPNTSYTSYVNGRTLGAALDISFSFSITGFALPTGGTTGCQLQINGVSLQEISQANDLNGKMITVKAGMQKGLPLANPAQNGTILTGQIYQAYGNWIAPNSSLNFVIYGAPGVEHDPIKDTNLTFLWPKNTPLADAIKSTFSAAFPGKKTEVHISPQLKMSSDQYGTYQRLDTFAKAVQDLTRQKQFAGIKTTSGQKYDGVTIYFRDNVLYAEDSTELKRSGNSVEKPKIIDGLDLVGQPTWINANQIDVSCVMRADIAIKDYVKLPSGLISPFVLTSPQAAQSVPGTRNNTTFQGVFNVSELFHFGHFRGTDALSWITKYTLTAVRGSEPGGGGAIGQGSGSGAAP